MQLVSCTKISFILPREKIIHFLKRPIILNARIVSYISQVSAFCSHPTPPLLCLSVFYQAILYMRTEKQMKRYSTEYRGIIQVCTEQQATLKLHSLGNKPPNSIQPFWKLHCCRQMQGLWCREAANLAVTLTYCWRITFPPSNLHAAMCNMFPTVRVLPFHYFI